MSQRYIGGLVTQSPTLPNPARGNAANGIFNLNQYRALLGSNNWPAVDPYFDYVTLMLHGNGTNGAQNNTFLDSSTNNFTITRNGNTTQGTFTPYGSNWSNYFNGSSDYLIAGATSSSIGSGDFTIEMWFNATVATNNGVFQTGNGLSTSYQIGIVVASNLLYIGLGNAGVSSTGIPVTVGTWNHIAVSRQSGTTRVYLNGLQARSSADSYNYTDTYFTIGGYYSTAYLFNGSISNVRVVSGTALYTSAFTPPTNPLTAVSGTILLTCQANRFIDSSSSAATITRTGTPSVQRFSPFNPGIPWGTSTIGGSGYFDGSGDYLSAASNAAFAMGTGNFTVEAWVYLPVTQNFGTIFLSSTTGAGNSLHIQISSANKIRVTDAGTEYLLATNAIPLNAWTHIAVVRSGTTLTIYQNGTANGSTTNSTDFTQSGALVGLEPVGGSFYLTGYLTDVRVVKGTAVYTATFTPPTAPLTAITNTIFLLNYTNGGIFDNAMMNNLETVGNAQISTSVVKYGTGSLYFDGTDDRLPMPASPNFAFGTGDFTIEFWMNSNNVSSSQLGMLQTSTTAGGLSTNYANGVVVYQGGNASGSPLNGGLTVNVCGTNIGSNTAVLTTGAWYHVAVARQAGTVRVFVNGNLHASGTAAGNCTGQNLVVGGYYSTSYLYNGYLDDFRVTTGYARYTAAFTPPTSQVQDQ